MDKKIENQVEKVNITIPFIVHESEMARTERHIKRLWIALLVAVIAVVFTNFGWLVYISQYDFESYEISTEGGGNANYIGQDGDIYNGKGESEETS